MNRMGPVTAVANAARATPMTSRAVRVRATLTPRAVAVRSPIWNWPAADLERLVRAQSEPYPSAFTFHKGERLEILAASVSEGRYGGTPGRIFYREGDGVVIVAGADAHTGRNHGLAVTRVRTEDGRELCATDYFTSMGGYLTQQRR